MIRVENLVYEYQGKRALDQVSFTIEPNTITALVGPNGAGKTTLLRCLAGIDEPFSGKITVAGLDVSQQPRAVHKQLGYLSDFFGVYQYLTVRQCLMFACKLHQITGKKLEKQLADTIKLLGLEPYLELPATGLSRGWRQRLGIAQAIIHRPRLVLLDEPASGLDPEARMGLSELMRNLHSQGMTLVVSSHVLAELEDYCTEMLILRGGKVVDQFAAFVTQSSNVIDIGFLDDAELVTALLKTSPDTSRFMQNGNVVHVEFSGGEEQQQMLLKRLMEAGVRISSFAVHKKRLQDVYMALSGKKDDDRA